MIARTPLTSSNAKPDPILISIAKMMFQSALFLLTLASPLVSAVGKARVVNNCTFDATAWSVDSKINGPFTLKAKGGKYEETFHRDPVTGGIAIKVTRNSDGLYTGAPQLNYAYSLDGSQVWYDLSSVFGDAFPGRKLVEKSANNNCPSIVWTDGTPPKGSQVKVCAADKDVTLTLCAV
ncbi:Antigenic thaumatin-like protein [Paramyrothecium foliicola]|nr:Antigenic thaumatin-like protein [Paramyrothecium foliicola]